MVFKQDLADNMIDLVEEGKEIQNQYQKTFEAVHKLERQISNELSEAAKGESRIMDNNCMSLSKVSKI